MYDALRKRDLGFTVEKEFNAPGLFLGSVLNLNVRARAILQVFVMCLRRASLSFVRSLFVRLQNTNVR